MNRIDGQQYLTPYGRTWHIELPNGYIVWRRGTGNNIELLHIKTYAPGRGTGRQLVIAMLEELKKQPPYCTVFGFTRECNEGSQKFYEALGFELTTVKGVYQDGSAVVFSQEYRKLLEINNADRPCVHT